MYMQAKSIFQKFKDLLEAAGGKMNDIMSITVYVTNLDENTEVWRARREFFTGDFPCSTLIEVKRVVRHPSCADIVDAAAALIRRAAWHACEPRLARWHGVTARHRRRRGR